MSSINKKYKKLLIYGTGKMAENVISEIDFYRLVGIIDRFEVFGIKFGLPIYEWSDIKAGDADAVVIAAPTAFIKEIYIRILPFCAVREIAILSSSGQNMQQYFGIGPFSMEHANHINSKKKLKEKIVQYDVISFDIFDTLLSRKIASPIDVFRLMETRTTYKNFHRIRRHAELICVNGNIYEIYDKIKKILNIDDIEIKKLIELEISCEKEILTIRQDMLDLFEFAQKAGKKVVLTSDMYFTSNMLQVLLEQMGYSGMEKIYVSCEYKTSKSSVLFKFVRQDYPNQNILHIGDNVQADIFAPSKYKIDVAWIKSESDLISESPIGRYRGWVKTLSDALLWGNITDILFNSPFEHNEKPKIYIKNFMQFSRVFFEPFILKYFENLIEYLQQYKYDGVLFVARDGYILQKCYEILKEKNLLFGPPSNYILCSRKLAIRSGMNTIDDLKTVLEFHNPECMDNPLYQLFGVSEAHISIHQSKEYLMSRFPDIKEHSKKTRQAYLAYFEYNNINLDNKYLVCELDGHGTSAYFLNKLFKKGIGSYYLHRWHAQMEYEIGSVSLYDYYDREKEYSSIFQYTTILESVITSDASSVVDMDIENGPMYSIDSRTAEQIDDLRKIQSQIIRFFPSDFVFICNQHGGKLTNELVEGVFETISEMNFVGECKKLNDWDLIDDLTGTELKAINIERSL